MSALLTIPVIINIGDVSIYLSANDNASGVLFGRRLSSPKSSLEIAMATDALRWGYEGNPAATTLRGTANYCLWLYGKYSLQAQNIISGSGGGTVSPITPNNPLPYQFYVAASGTLLVDGQSSVTISTFINYNLLFIRGGVPQSPVNTEPSYYSWDKTTGAFVCTPAASLKELFQIYEI